MKIAVVSDTHGNKVAMEKTLCIIEECDALLHLGDNVKDIKFYEKKVSMPIYSVKGNCDFTNSSPQDRVEEFQGKKIFMTHGHDYNVKLAKMNLKYKGKEVGADIVLFGHTHMPFLDYIDGMCIMNPGSVGNPRMSKASMGIITIDESLEDGIKTHIVELT